MNVNPETLEGKVVVGLTTDYFDRSEVFGYRQMDLIVFDRLSNATSVHPYDQTNVPPSVPGEFVSGLDVQSRFGYWFEEPMPLISGLRGFAFNDHMYSFLVGLTDSYDVSMLPRLFEDLTLTRERYATNVMCGTGHFHDLMHDESLWYKLSSKAVENLLAEHIGKIGKHLFEDDALDQGLDIMRATACNQEQRRIFLHRRLIAECLRNGRGILSDDYVGNLVDSMHWDDDEYFCAGDETGQIATQEILEGVEVELHYLREIASE